MRHAADSRPDGQTEIAITVYLSDRQPTAQISLMTTTIACPLD